MDRYRKSRRRLRQREVFPDFEPFEDQASFSSEPSFQARAVASVNNEDESLYEQLLRHHHDTTPEGSDIIDTSSIKSEDDRKLPAISPQNSKRVRPQQFGVSPHSKNHLHPISPPILQFQNSKGDKEATYQQSIGRDDSSTVSDSVNEMKPFARSSVLKSFREQSSFYKSALEAAGEISHKTPMNDVETDELIARELAELQRRPPPTLALDEQLAREFQAAQEPLPPLTVEEQDVALALKLMQQEEQELQRKQRQRQFQQQQQRVDTSSDEELAIRLSKELAFERASPGDELLARQLSCFEKESMRSPSLPDMVPEQIQILERIQQDKERELLEKAIVESSLHEIPGFMEPDDGVGQMISRGTGDVDYRLSQAIAFREWSSSNGQSRRYSRNDPPSTMPTAHGINETNIDRSYSSWTQQTEPDFARSQGYRSPSGNFSWTRPMEPNYMSHSVQDRGLSGSFLPGRAVAVDLSGRETSIDPRPSIPFTPLRSALPVPRMTMSSEPRSSSLEPPRQSSLPSVRSHGFRNNSLTPFTGHTPRAQQDLRSLGPSADLLRRGNEETRTAIASGRAHVVVCQGCRNRLLAPKNYSLVLCPTCNIISPGSTMGNEFDDSSSREGRSRSFN